MSNPKGIHKRKAKSSLLKMLHLLTSTIKNFLDILNYFFG